MSYEVYTYGDQDLLRFIFNAVAMMFKANDYMSIVKFAMIGGFAFILSQVIFTKKYTNMLTSFFIFMIVYSFCFGMKSKVVLIDKINHASVPVIVKDVPFALAYWAFLTTKMGYDFTSTMEQAFQNLPPINGKGSLHADSAYTESGMLFYSNLMLESRQQGVGATLKYSMDEYFKQCVYPGIQHNIIQITDLLTSTDMFSFINAAAMQGWFTKYQDTKGQITAISCEKAYANMDHDLAGEKDAWLAKLGHSMFPNANKITSKTLVMNSLPNAEAYFMKNAGTAQKMLNDQIAKDSAIDAGAVWGASIGSQTATDLFLKARTNIQTLNTYHSAGLQAAEWVPILKNVFEALYYGAFPLVCLLIFTPLTKTVIMGYGGAFIWLQSWAPLYAILNLIMTLKEQNSLWNTSNDLLHNSGMADIMLKTQAQAGMLSMSIPFLAGGIVFGASRMGTLARTLTAPAQQAATQSATEQTTGNHSYGNVSLGNMSSNNWNSNKLNTSSSLDIGGKSYVTSDGSTDMTFSDGTNIYKENQSSLKSNWSLSHAVQSSLHHSMSDANNAVTANVESALNNMSSAHLQHQGLSEEQNIQYNQAASNLKNLVHNDNHTMSADLKSSILAYAEGSATADTKKTIWGKIAKWTTGLSAKATAGIRGDATSTSSNSNTASDIASKADELRQSLTKAHNLSSKLSKDYQTNQAKAYSTGVTSNITKINEIRNMQSHMESDSSAYNRTITQDVFDKVYDANGGNVDQTVKDMDAGTSNKKVAKAVNEVTQQLMKDTLVNKIPDKDQVHQTHIQDNTDPAIDTSKVHQAWDNAQHVVKQQKMDSDINNNDIDTQKVSDGQDQAKVINVKAQQSATSQGIDAAKKNIKSAVTHAYKKGEEIGKTKLTPHTTIQEGEVLMGQKKESELKNTTPPPTLSNYPSSTNPYGDKK